jgi:hypothetical protein
MTELATRESGGDVVEVQIEGHGVVEIPTAMIEKYPALNPELDLTELLEGALGPGGEINLSDLTKIKVPSAELKRPMVPDEDGELVPVAELVAMPVAQMSRRSYWTSDDPSGQPPDCASNDLETGVGLYGKGSELHPTGDCATCPMSQRGSANKGTQGSACKEQRLVFVLTDRELLPLMVVVPAGSLQNHKKFGIGLAKRGVLGPARPDLGTNPRTGKALRGSAWLSVEIGLGLEQDTNPNGQDYNKWTFRQVRKLPPPELAVVAAYGRYIDELISKQADRLAETMDSAAANPTGESEAGTATGAAPQFDADDFPDDDVEVPASSGSGGRGR